MDLLKQLVKPPSSPFTGLPLDWPTYIVKHEEEAPRVGHIPNPLCRSADQRKVDVFQAVGL